MHGVFIILDESAFTEEIRTLLAAFGARFRKKVVGMLLLGDEMRLRVLVLSNDAKSNDAKYNEFGGQTNQSLYQRLKGTNRQVVILKKQRRP